MTDYGVPFLIVKWTAFTDLVPERVPAGVPRRLRIPLPRDSGLFNRGPVIQVEYSIIFYISEMHIEDTISMLQE